MGGGKESSTGSTTQVINQTTTPQPTAEETELNRLQIEAIKATQPGQIQVQQNAANLINALLTGQPLPGFFGTLAAGISPEVAQYNANQAVATAQPFFQTLGIQESGAAFAESSKLAADIFNAASEFNIGNLFNLANLAVGGQAQVQQPFLAQSQILGARLAGLRPVTTAGTTTGSTFQQTVGPNPFLAAFGGGLGEGFGKGFGTGLGGAIFK